MSGSVPRPDNRSKLTVPLDFLTELANADTPEDLYVSVATWLPDIFPAERISIALPIDEKSLRVVAVYGDEILYDAVPIPVDGSKIGDCYRSREPIVVNDADRPDEKYARAITPGQDRYRSTAILPLVVGDRCLGTLNFGCIDADRFDDDEVGELGKIATWIALQLSRYEALQQLTASQARFNALIDNATSIIFAKTVEGQILLANDMYCKAFGLSKEQVIGHTEEELFGRENAKQWRAEDARIIETGQAETFEIFLYTVGDKQRNYVTQKFPVYDPDRGESIICAISTDISHLKQVETALTESEQRARTFFNNSPNMMYMKDKKHVLRFANQTYLDFFGITEEEALGHTGSLYVDRDKIARFEEMERQIMSAQAVIQSEAQLPGRDGKVHDFVITKFPVYDADGNVNGIGGINTDVTELRQREKQLEAAKEEAVAAARNAENAAEKAKAADLAKTEFLASMSHELRTPLNGILGMTHLLTLDPLDGEQLNKVATIQDSGNALLVILNDILDLSKVEAGELEIDVRQFRLADLISSIESLWEPQVTVKGLRWSCEIGHTAAPVLVGDDARLRQVIFNLVSNAVKFTEHGSISLRVAQTVLPDGRIQSRFEIADTGSGIPPGLEARLFDKFTQADSTIARRYGGTGLGLAICKSLVRLMGGDIGYKSETGEGTNFWFTVICDRAADDAIIESDEENRPKPLPAAGPLNILIAEDNEVNQKIISLMLQRQGHALEIVSNGMEAVKAATGGDYDLILMDIQMPEMDGIAATRRIRALDSPRGNVPIIALTANAMKGDREIYLDAGMNDYVAKPIEPDALAAALGRQTGTDAAISGPVAPARADGPQSADEIVALGEEMDALFDEISIDVSSPD